MSVGTGIKVLPPRYDLAHALLTVGLLIDAIYSFVMRLGARDIDTSVYDFIVNRSGFCSYVFARAPVDVSRCCSAVVWSASNSMGVR